MALIQFDHVTIDFPIYNSSSRSIKDRLVRAATGGTLRRTTQGAVVVRALEDLNFTLNDGDRLGLIGHNGSGKSTLLRVLGGTYSAPIGDVHIEGNIGSLIDISLGIDEEFTGRENVLYRGRLLGMRKKMLEERMDEIMAFADLGDFFELPVRTYSSGMQLRLAFAVSTMIRPNILLMDEWLSVGDEDFKHKADQRLSELVDAINILVIASHSRDLILKSCTRVFWMEHGRIRMDGDPEEVTNAYFGKPG